MVVFLASAGWLVLLVGGDLVLVILVVRRE